MGNEDESCCPCWGKPEVIENDFFLAYYAMKDIFLSLQYDRIELEKMYLIKTKSIPQFIEIIEKSEILDFIKDNKKSDKDIIKSKNYKYLKKNYHKFHYEDNDIKIYDSYNDCEKLSKMKDDPDNEFIIVNADFINKRTNKENYNLDGKNVKINIDKYNSKMKMEIYFPISQKIINFKEKRTGIYQFLENNEEKIPDINELMPHPDNSLDEIFTNANNNRENIPNIKIYNRNEMDININNFK